MMRSTLGTRLARGFLVMLVLVPSLATAAGSLSARQPAFSRLCPQTFSVGPQCTESSNNDLLYVSNDGDNSITIYRQNATGNTPPIAVIAGPNTGLNAPDQLSEDSLGNLYVLNAPNSAPSVLVFRHGAYGNVFPIRRLAGPHTGFHIPSGLLVDQNTGDIFITDTVPIVGLYLANLLRFPRNAFGDTAPSARSMTAFVGASQLASDSTGNHLIEAHSCGYDKCDTGGVYTFVKQFANGAVFDSIYTVIFLPTLGLADDPSTKTYLVTGDGGIYRLAENTIGYGPDGLVTVIPDFIPSPVALITSAINCGQLALGYLRDIYAVCGGSIAVFAPTASGNAAPLRVLSGAATGLSSPKGVYIGK